MRSKILFSLSFVILICSCVKNKNVFYKYEYNTEYKMTSTQFPDNVNYDSLSVDDVIITTEIVQLYSSTILYKNRDTIFFVYPADTSYYDDVHFKDSSFSEIDWIERVPEIRPEYAMGPYLYNVSNQITPLYKGKPLYYKWLSKTDTLDYQGEYGLNEFCTKNSHSGHCRIFYSGREEVFKVGEKKFNCDIFITYCPKYSTHSESYFELLFIEKESSIIFKSEMYRLNRGSSYGYEDMKYERYETNENNFVGRTYLVSVSQSDLTPTKVKSWNNCP